MRLPINQNILLARLPIFFFALLLFAGCGEQKESPPRPVASQEASGTAICKTLGFAKSIPVAEASGATMWQRPAKSIFVVSDSGNHGEYVVLNPEDGTVLQQGRLPLDSGAGDDLEGLSADGPTLVAINSAGYLRHWQAQGEAYALVEKAYSIAQTTEIAKLFTCASPHQTNCRMNYEALCLNPAPGTHPCRGFAGSKRTGTLYCLEKRGNRFFINPTFSIPVSPPEALSGCHFSADGQSIWVANNLVGRSRFHRIDHWGDATKRTMRPFQPKGIGFPEAISVDKEQIIYRFSDTTGSPSLANRYRCE